MTGSIGYIGLGAMGAPMLKRLADHVGAEAAFGFDIDADVAKSVCTDAGANVCDTVAEIAGSAGVLFSCVPNDEALLSVYLEDGGVSSAIAAGTVTVDFSTVSPKATMTVSHALKAAGVAHLDASMLGSVRQAREGTISFVVGGDADALARVTPLLDVLGGAIWHCGESGAGNRMKLVHQTLVAGHAAAVGEAIALCRHVGIDVDTFYQIVTQGTGLAGSRYFEQRVPRMCGGDFAPLFMLKLMAKDARLARAMVDGDAESSPMPVLDSVIASLTLAEDLGLGGEDFSAALKAAERRFSVLADGAA